MFWIYQFLKEHLIPFGNEKNGKNFQLSIGILRLFNYWRIQITLP